MTSLGLGLLMSTLVFTVSRSSRAEGDPVRLRYGAEASCPGPDAFRDAVAKRTPKARRPRPGETPRLFTVMVSKHRDGYQADLRILEPDGSLAERSLRASSCDEAVEGIALVVALAVDPHASLTATGSAGDPELVALQDAPAAAPEAAPAREPRRAAPPAPTVDQDARPSRLPLEVRVSGGYGSALTPRRAPAVAAAVARSVAWGAFEPTLRVDYLHGFARSARNQEGEARFAADLLGLEACPLVLGAGTRLELEACARWELGRVSAEGSDTSAPKLRHRLWSAGGLELGAGAGLTQQWWLGLAAQLVAPTTRDRYVLNETEAFEVPTLGWRASLYLAWRPW